MKILWVKSDFLHPTSRGGQIRTLETIRRLHDRNEVHYIAFNNLAEPEGLARAKEYCSYVYPVRHYAPPRRSLKFAAQAAGSLFSPLPLAVARWVTPAMREQIRQVRQQHHFDSVVCDFVAPSPNFDSLRGCVLFQHNVETMIWRRHAEHASDPFRRAYFDLQARRMFECEKRACLEAAHIIAVSAGDASQIHSMFGVDAEKITSIPTGVDIDYFRRPAQTSHETDLVFVGAMDWTPNVDGVQYFVREILPLILREQPACTLTVVGRKPSPDILALAGAHPRIRITGTVADVRPHLWGARVSIVPLRIGGGTRLKIYESMAGSVPVVSTTVGAEGLDVKHPATIRLADTPAAFAAECLQLLQHGTAAEQMADAALHLVTARFSWDRIAQDFEGILAGAAKCAV
jgi:glycosyltransferase involved in cell wall biosynthesis